jgi:hypothetical protein
MKHLYIRETRVFQPNITATLAQSENYTSLVNPILAHYTPFVTLTDAHRCVHMSAYSHGPLTLVLQFTNFVGMCEVDRNTRTDATFPVFTTSSFGVNVSVEAARKVSSVQVATPDANDLAPLTYFYNATCGGTVNFDLTTGAYSVLYIYLFNKSYLLLVLLAQNEERSLECVNEDSERCACMLIGCIQLEANHNGHRAKAFSGTEKYIRTILGQYEKIVDIEYGSFTTFFEDLRTTLRNNNKKTCKSGDAEWMCPKYLRS